MGLGHHLGGRSIRSCRVLPGFGCRRSTNHHPHRGRPLLCRLGVRCACSSAIWGSGSLCCKSSSVVAHPTHKTADTRQLDVETTRTPNPWKALRCATHKTPVSDVATRTVDKLRIPVTRRRSRIPTVSKASNWPSAMQAQPNIHILAIADPKDTA